MSSPGNIDGEDGRIPSPDVDLGDPAAPSRRPSRATTGSGATAGPPSPASLWHHRDFLKLWAGQTVSLYGSAITQVALPLTAVLALNASSQQLGLLRAAEYVPYLLFGLVAGVWVDRRRQRPLLIAADVGRAVLLAAVPLAAGLHVLSLGFVYVVAFAAGTLTMLFEIAYVSYLPTLVNREHLLEGNSKIGASRSTSVVAGPGLGGLLVQMLTAPVALLADAISYVVSALALAAIRFPQRAPTCRAEHKGWRQEIGVGLRLLFGTPLLRALVCTFGAFNLCASALLTVYVLYLIRQLGLNPSLFGFTLAVGGVGAVAGALSARLVVRRLGVGATIIGAMLIGGAGSAVVASAFGPPPVAIAVLCVAQFVNGLGVTVTSITVMSLRQAVTPSELHGRVTATMRFVISGARPIGAVAGGFLGGVVGFRTTILIAALGQFLSALWLSFSPMRTLRTPPLPFAVPTSIRRRRTSAAGEDRRPGPPPREARSNT